MCIRRTVCQQTVAAVQGVRATGEPKSLRIAVLTAGLFCQLRLAQIACANFFLYLPGCGSIGRRVFLSILEFWCPVGVRLREVPPMAQRGEAAIEVSTLSGDLQFAFFSAAPPRLRPFPHVSHLPHLFHLQVRNNHIHHVSLFCLFEFVHVLTLSADSVHIY